MHIQGKNLLIAENSSGTYEAIAAAKNCELTMSAEVIETASPSSADFKSFLLKRKSWTMSASTLIPANASGETHVRGAILRAGTQYNLAFGVSNDKLYGTAICTEAKVTAQVGNLVQGSFVFQGTGALQ